MVQLFSSYKPKSRSCTHCNPSARSLHSLAQGKKEIILREHGYDKVLGNGEIRAPIKVIAKSFSARAAEKIEAAKGTAVIDE